MSSSAVAGAGTGSTPCSVLTVPLPTLTGERGHRFDVQKIERDTRADDVGNRIHRADFVKVNLADLGAVHCRFGLGKPLENRRAFFRARWLRADFSIMSTM